MTANANQNVEMFQGTSRTLRFTITGTNLTTATAIIWRAVPASLGGSGGSGGSPVITKTLAGGGIGNLTSTSLDVLLFPSDTTALTPGAFTHELRITDATSNQDVVADGTITLDLSITQ